MTRTRPCGEDMISPSCPKSGELALPLAGKRTGPAAGPMPPRRRLSGPGSFSISEPQAGREHQVDVLGVGVVLVLEDVRPGVAPLQQHARLPQTATAVALDVGMDRGEDAADDVVAAAKTGHLALAGAPAAADVAADAPVEIGAVGRAPQVPLPAPRRVDEGPVEAPDAHRGLGDDDVLAYAGAQDDLAAVGHVEQHGPGLGVLAVV